MDPDRSLFLWGPRQVGKSSLLKQTYPEAITIELLKNEEFTAYQTRPELLRERVIQNKWKFLVIDEVQKVPQILDEVHYLIEAHGTVFGLCGSSARKLRATHANMLGGRALRFEMAGLVSAELDPTFSSLDLERLLERGYLPTFYDSDNYLQLHKSYCADYLKEEIFAEGLVRRLEPFNRFLEIAAMRDTEVTNFRTIARDCGVSSPTVKAYYTILVDTLLGRFLPPYAVRPKRRQVLSPKFYFFDVGVVNYLSQRSPVRKKSPLFGKAFENWVHHEISAWIEYRQRPEQLTYWGLASGAGEVDFIIGHMKCAIEAKATERVTSDHCKGLRELSLDYPEVGRRIIVSLEPISRRLPNGIEVLSAKDFVKELWCDQLLQ